MGSISQMFVQLLLGRRNRWRSGGGMKVLAAKVIPHSP